MVDDVGLERAAPPEVFAYNFVGLKWALTKTLCIFCPQGIVVLV